MMTLASRRELLFIMEVHKPFAPDISMCFYLIKWHYRKLVLMLLWPYHIIVVTMLPPAQLFIANISMSKSNII